MEISMFANRQEFRPKGGSSLHNALSRTVFFSFLHTQGVTTTSFAPGYHYFAHTGLNTHMGRKES